MCRSNTRKMFSCVVSFDCIFRIPHNFDFIIKYNWENQELSQKQKGGRELDGDGDLASELQSYVRYELATTGAHVYDNKFI